MDNGQNLRHKNVLSKWMKTDAFPWLHRDVVIIIVDLILSTLLLSCFLSAWIVLREALRCTFAVDLASFRRLVQALCFGLVLLATKTKNTKTKQKN